MTKVTKHDIPKLRKEVTHMGRISSPQGKGSQLHNRREYEKIGREIPDNIDTTRTHLNVTVVDRDIREAYQEIFGEALQKYNDKQKRADRKIEDYYDHISKSKNGEKLFYEDVIQWGTKDDFEKEPQLKEIAKDCLEEYARSFEERNPNLKLIGAYIHMDEVSPHLHLDYIPVAHGYKKGLETRNSLDKAMKEMGYVPEKESRKNNATKLWKEAEREYFGNVCRSKGLEVEVERKARGSLSVEEYKEARDNMIGELIKEKKVVENELAAKSEALDQQANELKKVGEISALMAQVDSKEVEAYDYTIPEKKSFIGRIEAPEQKGVFIKGLDEEEVHSLFKRNIFNDNLEELYIDAKRQAEEEATKIVEEATREANMRLAVAQMQITQAQDILEEKEKLKEEIATLNRTKEKLIPKVSHLYSREKELSERIEQLENGWTEERNYILTEHKGLNELENDYQKAEENLVAINYEINKKIDIAMNGFTPEEARKALNDSLVKNLVNEVAEMTCKQLGEQNYMKCPYMFAFLQLDTHSMIRSLEKNIGSLIEKIKAHMRETIINRHNSTRDIDHDRSR